MSFLLFWCWIHYHYLLYLHKFCEGSHFTASSILQKCFFRNIAAILNSPVTKTAHGFWFTHSKLNWSTKQQFTAIHPHKQPAPLQKNHFNSKIITPIYYPAFETDKFGQDDYPGTVAGTHPSRRSSGPGAIRTKLGNLARHFGRVLVYRFWLRLVNFEDYGWKGLIDAKLFEK